MSESRRAPVLVLNVSVPAEGELGIVVADLAARVAEHLGHALQDAGSVGRAVDRAVSEVLPASGGAEIALEFRELERELIIQARCGARSSEVICPLSA